MSDNLLRSLLQGASNSAASNVSAPVDGIAWLLRKAGLDIKKPVGGSDWMAERGLTAEPQNRLAGLIGEGLGGVAPMFAVAKAPQIAAGINRMAENAMVPRTMNPQTGAVVWHGSPHKFDAFDASKIGTGEGAQAYGHGLYLADEKAVAQGYRDKLSGNGYFSGDGNYFMKNDSKGTFHKYDSKTKDAALINEAEFYKDAPASLYKVDLPDEHIAKMLDWDKPLSGQAQAMDSLGAALDQTRLGNSLGVYKGKIPTVSLTSDRAFGGSQGEAAGSDLYRALSNASTHEEAAALLRKQGIPGIRYLDGGSRGAGAGSSNYVLFPGNENLLSILDRNGQAVKGR